MTPEQFSRYVDQLRDQVSGRGPFGEGPRLGPEEALAALGTTMEQLGVAEEELLRQNEELLRAREEREEERRRYHELFELAPDIYLVTDAHAVIREANAAASELLAIRPSFLTGKPLATFLPEEGRHAFRAEVARLTAPVGPPRARLPLRLRPRLGDPFYADASVAVVRDRQGVATGLRWLIRDVTDLEEAQERLRELNFDLERRVRLRTEQLEDELRAKEHLLIGAHAAYSGSEATGQSFLEIIHGVDAIIWKADAATGRFTFVSRQAEAILGHPPARWLDDPDFWSARLHPEDREWVLNQRRRALAEGRDHELEYRLMAADDRAVWFREGVRFIAGEAGHPAELRGLMVNISRRKKVERQLYTAKGELSAQVQDLSHLYDLSRRLVTTRDLQPVLDEILGAVAALLGADRGLLWLLDPVGDRVHAVAGLGLHRRLAEYTLSAGLAPLAPLLREGRSLIVPDVEADPLMEPLRGTARRDDIRSFFAVPLISEGEGGLGFLAALFPDRHRPPERQVRLVEHYAALAAECVCHARRLAEAREALAQKDEALATLAQELSNPLAPIRETLRRLALPDAEAAELELARSFVERQAQQLARLAADLQDAS